MTLQLMGRITTGDAFLDNDLRDLDIISTEIGSFLCTTNGQNGGLSTWSLSDSGELAQLTDSTHFSVWGLAIGSFDAVDVDGQTQVILSGTGSGKLIRYRIADDGGLYKAGKIDLPGLTTQNHDALTTATLSGGHTALYTVNAATGELDGWLSSGNGALASDISFETPIAPLSPVGPVMLVHAEVGGVQFLLAVDDSTQGVRSYRIEDDTGRLRARDSCGVTDGLGFALPTALETVSAHGATWVILAAAGSSSLSVMKLAANGALTPTDHILDTLATRFAGVTALEVVEADGHVFVLAGGADDGISLFYLLPGGHLVHVETVAQDIGLGLDNITGITAVRLGDALQIFVTSGGDGGVSQFTLPLEELGAVVDATDNNVPLPAPTDGAPFPANPGQTTLQGHAGDDILVSDANGGVLTGGAGADIFVLRPTEGTLIITDFQSGTDQLDLTQFPMLRSIEQLDLTPTLTGITIKFGTTQIGIHSHDGTPLSAADLWPDGFSTPDRIAILAPSETPILGTSGADDLLGSLGSEWIRAGGGDDIIRARAGHDFLAGGTGNDRLYGGMGRDTLEGNGADDVLIGARGADLLQGNSGADRLFGGKGNDTLEGGIGADKLHGGQNADTLTGNAGRDVFVFANDHGKDKITDFRPGEDYIQLDMNGLGYEDLAISASGANTLIDTGSGTITLIGLTPDGLDADDFLFL